MDKKIVESKMNVFNMPIEEEQSSDSQSKQKSKRKNKNAEFKKLLDKFGFKDEPDMLLNLESKNLSEDELKEIINFVLDNFEYYEAELIKIIGYLFRTVFD